VVTESGRFDDDWRILGVELGLDGEAWRGLGEELRTMHEEPHRAYHGVAHVEAVLGNLGRLVDGPVPVELALASFFHDAIYDPLSSRNEHLSAVLARERLAVLGVDASVADTTTSVIEATATHIADDELMAVFLDADLAILGAPTDGYRLYTEGIRFEYAHMDDAAYRAGRAAVLQGFLERPQIFVTEMGRRLYEQQARLNLLHEVAALEG
jgi:predicted metal-dependent HD superfamily phosphohydrolase